MSTYTHEYAHVREEEREEWGRRHGEGHIKTEARWQNGWNWGWGSEADHLPVLHRVLSLVLSPQGGLAWKAEAEIGVILSSAKNPQKLEEAGRLFSPLQIL